MIDRPLPAGAEPSVAVLHHDVGILDSACAWIAEGGFRVVRFSSPEELRKAMDPDALACVVTAYYFIDGRGRSLLEWVRAADSFTSVVFLSNRASVPIAVESIRNGAFDFVEWPVSREHLLEVVETAVSNTLGRRFQQHKERHEHGCLDALSEREREVCEQLMVGATSKEIARLLHISPRTVEHHRASLMRKAGVSSTVELVGLVSSERASRKRAAESSGE